MTPYGYACNRQAPAEIRLYEHTDCVTAGVFRQRARTRSDPAFPPERDRAFARAHRTFFNGPASRVRERLFYVVGTNVPAANIIQPAVVRLSHYGIDRAHIFIAGPREFPGRQSR